MVDFEEDIKKCIETLNRGGVILYPTDTIWGLGCDALNEQATDKIYEIKQRPKEKSMIVLLAEARDLLQYVAAPHPDIIAIAESFGRPTTVVYYNALDLPRNVINSDGSIAIRVTDDPFCKALIKRLRKPLISTSANISGQPSPAVFSMISNDIVSKADYVVKYRQNDTTPRSPSRLVKINDDGEVFVLRS